MARLWYLLPAGWAAPNPNPNPNPNSNQGGPRRPESPYHLLLDVIRSEARAELSRVLLVTEPSE